MTGTGYGRLTAWQFGPGMQRAIWVFTASAKAGLPAGDRGPVCGNPVINQSEVYSGMYGRVNVTFYPYVFGGKERDRMRPGPGSEVKGRRGTERQPRISGTSIWSTAAKTLWPHMHSRRQAGIDPITGLPY